MTQLMGEFVGTAILILLGNGTVANVVLRGTKSEGAGWIVITWGWGMAVFVAVFMVGRFSGAHINPAVTLGLAMTDQLAWGLVPGYVAAQFAGAAVGALLVWVHFFPHWGVTEDLNSKLACFCTGPAIRHAPANVVSEVIGTFVLVLAVLFIAAPDVGLGALDALPVGLLVLVIGLGLGGTTGYAINPARDLGPRIVHALLPMPGGKRDSDWSYAWIPVLGPVIGALLAAAAYLALGSPEVELPAL